MYLLHNEILYINSSQKMVRIPYDEIIAESRTELRQKLQNASSLLFGGIGFSEYNDEFNATNAIYGDSLDRNGEISETQKFYDDGDYRIYMVSMRLVMISIRIFTEGKTFR